MIGCEIKKLLKLIIFTHQFVIDVSDPAIDDVHDDHVVHSLRDHVLTDHDDTACNVCKHIFHHSSTSNDDSR